MCAVITTILGTDQATNSRSVINTNFSNLNTDKYQSGDSAVFSAAQITGLTASRILATDASSNIQALSTSTYPSLTEFSYLKGITSAIQTQLDAKSPLASPTFSGAVGIGAAASSNASRLYVVNTTHSSGVLSQFNVTQTTINASDTGDAILSAYYTLSASSATNQLVSRGLQFAMSNGLTGGGILSNARGINITYTTAASTTTTAWDAIYIDSGTASGTVTTGRGLVIAGLQGTTKYGIYDAVGTKWVNASGGSLGIGTVTPGTSLEVVGTGFTGISVGRRTDVTTVSGILYFDSSTSGYGMRNNDGVLEFLQGAVVGSGAGTIKMSLNTSGQLFMPGASTMGAINYAADGQASDTYVITLAPVPTAYTTGMQVIFKANTANTGAATLNVNGLGAKTIVKAVSTTLSDNDILASMFCLVVYDGTNFVLMNPRAL